MTFAYSKPRDNLVKRWFPELTITLTLTLSSAHLLGQINRGTIVGAVTEPTGAVTPDAKSRSSTSPPILRPILPPTALVCIPRNEDE